MTDVQMHEQAHGYFTIAIQDNLVFIDGFGPFNTVFVDTYEKVVPETIRCCVREDSFYVPVHPDGTGRFAPGAAGLIQDLHVWRAKMGLRHIAVIHSHEANSGALVTEAQFDRGYEFLPPLDCRERFFTGLKGAVTWLREEGYERADDSFFGF